MHLADTTEFPLLGNQLKMRISNSFLSNQNRPNAINIQQAITVAHCDCVIVDLLMNMRCVCVCVYESVDFDVLLTMSAHRILIL